MNKGLEIGQHLIKLIIKIICKYKMIQIKVKKMDTKIGKYKVRKKVKVNRYKIK